MKKILIAVLAVALVVVIVYNVGVIRDYQEKKQQEKRLLEQKAQQEQKLLKYVKDIEVTDEEIARWKDTYVIVDTTYGSFAMKLLPEAAPQTVKNFVELVNMGFYNGLAIPKIYKEMGLLSPNINPDIELEPFFIKDENLSTPQKGDVHLVNMGAAESGMALANSGSTQFLVCFGETNMFNRPMSKFGEIVKGFDVLEKISDMTPEQIPEQFQDPSHPINVDPAPPDAFIQYVYVSKTLPADIGEVIPEEERFLGIPLKQYDVTDEEIAQLAKTKAKIVTTAGDIVIEFTPDTAPQATKNFVELAKDGFYSGNAFYKVEPDTMIQAGSKTMGDFGGPGYRIVDDADSQEWFAGAVAFKNPGKNLAGSQFVINLSDESTLPESYTIFGKVVEGLEVVKKISELPAIKMRPKQKVVIEKVELITG